MVAVPSVSQVSIGSVLALEKVSRHFGGIAAVQEVTLTLLPGERRAIIGPNGAGKSTLFSLVAGDLFPTQGRIWFLGKDITHQPPYHRVRLGIARTYQTPRIFPSLMTIDNVFVAARGVRPWRFSMLRPRTDDQVLALAHLLLRRVGLADVSSRLAGTLSHGEQRQLELAMALATHPKLLLLDEPAAGLSLGERILITELLLSLEPDLTILLVEHDMEVALRVAQRVTVLHEGRIVADGTPEEISRSTVVQSLYLGGLHG